MSRKSGHRFSNEDMRHSNEVERIPLPLRRDTHSCRLAPGGRFAHHAPASSFPTRSLAKPDHLQKKRNSMPTLRTGGNSPFGRKARIAVKVLGLEGKVALAAAST